MKSTNEKNITKMKIAILFEISKKAEKEQK